MTASLSQAEPLSGRVERIFTWRWADIPIKKKEQNSDNEELEDDVMQGGWGLHVWVGLVCVGEGLVGGACVCSCRMGGWGYIFR